MGSHAALIKRLEEAKEGSRELSDEVLVALGWRIGKPRRAWAPNRDFYFDDQVPDPSRNLQDAVDLVPEGWAGGGRLVGEPPYAMELLNTNEDESGFVNSSANTPAPALALCIAILRTMEVRDG